MGKVKIERDPSGERLSQLDVESWPIWTKETSEFPWTYDETETCYFLEGEVVVLSDEGDEIKMGKGDLVTFPKGMSCTWKVRQPVRKHYLFGD